MFRREIVVDARGHLLGRLASYVAKQLLNGLILIIQGKELLLSDAKESISLAHYSEIRSNLQSFWERDSWPIQEEHSFIIDLQPVFSGELSEEWSHTKLPEEPML